MSEDHIAVAINGVLYVKFEDAKKLREGWDKADAEIEKLRAALQSARRDALEKLERHFKEAAAGTPLGHENRQRGASTYNWLIYCASIIRALGEKE
jgi:hypothetical protein